MSKNPMIAFGLASAPALVIFGIVLLFTREVSVASQVAGLSTAFSPIVVFQILERQRAANLAEAGDLARTFSFSEFNTSWLTMALYGAMIVIGVLSFSGFIAGIILKGLDLDLDSLSKITPFIAAPLSLFAGYLIGRWIGERVTTGGLLAIILAAPIGVMAGVALDFATIKYLAAEESKLAMIDLTATSGWVRILIQCSQFWLPAIAGYFRGKRLRLRKYMGYLLKFLPKSTQNDLVTLAAAEAQRLALGAPKLGRAG